MLQHLDGGNNGLVEVKEVAAAVRMIRRYEGIIKAATRNGTIRPVSANGGGRYGGLIRPPSPTSAAGRTRLLAGGSTVVAGKGGTLDDSAEKGWSGGDDGTWGGGTGDLWEWRAASGLGGRMSSLEVRMSCRKALLRCARFCRDSLAFSIAPAQTPWRRFKRSFSLQAEERIHVCARYVCTSK